MKRLLPWGGLVVLLGGIFVTPAAGQPFGAPATVIRLAAPLGAIRFGEAVAGLPDLDGDSSGDVVVGAPGSDHAYVVGAATGAILRHLQPPAVGGLEFGAAVASVGDVDRDGVGDVAVGAPPETAACQAGGTCAPSDGARGLTFVFSGASGVVLQALTPATTANVDFGRSLAGAGDLSGDGVPDVLVGAPGLGQETGSVLAYSGANGALLWSRVGPTASFGRAVAASPDVSGDGVTDVLVSGVDHGTSPHPTSGLGQLLGLVPALVDGLLMPVVPSVFVLSGSTGAVVRTISDPEPHDGDGFGVAVGAIGDQDGDGIVDHLVGEPGTKRLHLYSGDDGILIRTVPVPGETQGRVRLAIAPVGDADDDRRGDVWVGVPSTRTAYLMNGTGEVLASQASPSPGGTFGAAVDALRNSGGVLGADVVLGDPTEPGGGAAYLLRLRPAGSNDELARVRAQAQTGPSETSTTVTTPTSSIPATATLPKPPSLAIDQPALAGTGGEDRLLAASGAVALGLGGLTVLRRARRGGAAGCEPG